jgi:hypothetical protein
LVQQIADAILAYWIRGGNLKLEVPFIQFFHHTHFSSGLPQFAGDRSIVIPTVNPYTQIMALRGDTVLSKASELRAINSPYKSITTGANCDAASSDDNHWKVTAIGCEHVIGGRLRWVTWLAW